MWYRECIGGCWCCSSGSVVARVSELSGQVMWNAVESFWWSALACEAASSCSCNGDVKQGKLIIRRERSRNSTHVSRPRVVRADRCVCHAFLHLPGFFFLDECHHFCATSRQVRQTSVTTSFCESSAKPGRGRFLLGSSSRLPVAVQNGRTFHQTPTPPPIAAHYCTCIKHSITFISVLAKTVQLRCVHRSIPRI